MDDEAEFQEIAGIMRQAIENMRKYASFWDYRPDRSKHLMELGIADEVITELQRSDLLLIDLKSRENGEDPPDCEAKLPSGSRVALEITEIVSQDAVHQAEKSDCVLHWAQWTETDLATELSTRLGNKDKKKLKGGPYEMYWVILHTDEPMLTHRFVETTIASMQSVATQQIDRAYLILSYDPRLSKYPVLRIPIKKSMLTD